MPVKVHVTRAGERVSKENAQIFGIPEGTPVNIALVGFLIEGGVLDPKELFSFDKEVDKYVNNPQKPLAFKEPVMVAIGGRGPHWLYGVLVHHVHTVDVVAIWEPRAKKGIIIGGRTKEELGKALNLDGVIEEISFGAKGKLNVYHFETDKYQLLHCEIRGDRIDPAELRRLPDFSVSSKPLIIEGAIPIWVGSHLAYKYMHKGPRAVGFYDPRLGGAVVSITHWTDYKVGDVIPIPSQELQSLLSKFVRKKTTAIGILGDPNSGKSVFLHILNEELRKRKFITLTQEADIFAPTQEWALHAPDTRKFLKKHMDYRSRLKWITSSLAVAKSSGTIDYILADLGGGRPDLGERLTKENLAILRYLDGVIIVSRNDNNQIKEWLEQLSIYAPDTKIYGVIESSLTEPAFFDEKTGIGRARLLDREAYRENRIPEDTRQTVEAVADRIVSEKWSTAGHYLLHLDTVLGREFLAKRVRQSI